MPNPVYNYSASIPIDRSLSARTAARWHYCYIFIKVETIIKNQKQYEYSQECDRKFAYSIRSLDQDEELKKTDPDGWQLSRDVKQSHLMALQAEIVEYERLINCDKIQPIQIQVESINKLSDALIKARIAAKISQQELAQILGIGEQRVRQYEDTDYQCASFVEILQVSTVLGVEFETAVMRVDFEEIEAVKESAEKWRKEKVSRMAKIS
ncbi:helix-turn-helix transcriptional regulator [Microcoleus sp. herbarium8]|uniref:helix-turn-helix transcriptional regulator n=1 Tax=Microcoleus sp. herbarium8 TaxID=3055436 RepID=UPI002FCFEE2D